MKSWLGVFLTVSIGAGCAPSEAAQVAQTSPVTNQLYAAVLDAKKLDTPAGRYGLIQATEAYCAEIDRSYPRNSPAEEQWLNTESNGGDARMMQAMRSAEIGRRFASNFVMTCKSATAGYAKGDKQRVLTLLAYAFHTFGRDAKYYAEKNGLNADELGLGGLSLAVEGFLVASLKSE